MGKNTTYNLSKWQHALMFFLPAPGARKQSGNRAPEVSQTNEGCHQHREGGRMDRSSARRFVLFLISSSSPVGVKKHKGRSSQLWANRTYKSQIQKREKSDLQFVRMAACINNFHLPQVPGSSQATERPGSSWCQGEPPVSNQRQQELKPQVSPVLFVRLSSSGIAMVCSHLF